jgi:hypothetical protein
LDVRTHLNAASVIKTIDRLSERIEQRFPQSGLLAVCRDMGVHARTVSARARRASSPYLGLRLLIVATILGAFAAVAGALAAFPVQRLQLGADLAGLTQGLDAAVHLLLVTGAAVWGLLTLEARLKRSRAIGDLYQLRSFAHVIDMHQLTKDPTVLLSHSVETAASPKREMSHFQLTRYLDYCSEMLSLIGKLAALYGEYSRDPQVVDAINSVEDLSGNLGRKIWQKITILSALDEEASVPRL